MLPLPPALFRPGAWAQWQCICVLLPGALQISGNRDVLVILKHAAD
jgi:hypothetical protein